MKKLTTALLDRDGTIIYNRHYLSDPDGVELMPGAAEGLRRLRDLGLRLVLITNQSGIGRGYFTEERLHEIHARLGAVLEREGVVLDGIFFCPHTPDDDCDCRKPRTGMVERAARELGFETLACVMIGDSAADMGLAQNLGIPGIFLPGQYDLPAEIQPAHTAASLLEAAHWLESMV